VSITRSIIRHEWSMLARSWVAMVALLLTLLLSIVAAATAIAHRSNNADIRERFQQTADARFDGQPARHPHRVVHYGHFVFRPLPPLAAFDPGVDSFTGNMIYLEGHRQNSANFGDVRQSSLLARFGLLTPAFVLQLLAPLVLIFVAFGIVARDREMGTLRQSLALGVLPTQLLVAKFAAVIGIAAILLAPAAAALAWLVASEGAPVAPATSLLGGYALYLLIWAAIITALSALVTQARTALLALLALWAVTAILVPRVAPTIALGVEPLPTRLETDIAIQRDLRAMGDSHDPDDPFFNEFRTRTLARYGVERVEDLPVNYRGLLAIEGERMWSELFDRYAADQVADHKVQARLVTYASALSPTIAIQRLSMAASGTDLDGHRRFLAQAEAYRYDLVQRLNQLQAEALTYSDDSNRNSDPEAGRRVRIDTQNWRNVPDFAYRAATTEEKLAAALPSALVLLGWLIAMALVLGWAVRRIAGQAL
jgi:ABC-2 type transport system permease protein